MARVHYLILFLITFNVVASEIKNVGWWKNAVFYQIYPRSFKDDNNDGIGDLKGITSKLQHFRDSGIDAIWLSPIYASPMVDFGYDIADFRKIHPDYGTNEDFDELVVKAHGMGIKVVLDLVPNHTSDDHEWFQQSKAGNENYQDYYIWRTSTGENDPPNNWLSRFGSTAWKYESSRSAWYLHQFHVRQPDLNYRNPKVKQEMEDIIKFWLNKGIDGFRVDAVPFLFESEGFEDEPRSSINATENEWEYLRHDYTQDQSETYDLVKSWRKVLDDFANSSNSDEKVMMTEAYTSWNNTVRYYDNGAHVPFNFLFITDINRNSKPDAVKTVIDKWMAETTKRKGTVANWVMGNHDNSRTESRYPGRGDQMTMLAMILPGVTVTYNGEEIGMVDKTDISFNDTQDPQGCNAGPDKYQLVSRDPNRTPMQWNDDINAGFNNGTTPWIPINDNFVDLNLAQQKEASASHYKNYQKLVQLKKTKAPLISGDLQTVVSSDKKTLTIARSTKNETILLIINFSDTESVTVDVASQLKSINAAATVLVTTLESVTKEGDSVDVSKLQLAPKQSVVLGGTVKITNTNTGEPDGAQTIALSSILAVLVLLLMSLEYLP
ncbi:maltase 1 [Fopius arisanus]|uniref:alpha-glucosidase n=2 Tax=Fopius arisanus TaxID=64838 RepID=A0A9R1U448_9HYME|nr:PREDICTED: maltase 1-like [Fopius arisanus]